MGSLVWFSGGSSDPPSCCGSIFVANCSRAAEEFIGREFELGLMYLYDTEANLRGGWERVRGEYVCGQMRKDMWASAGSAKRFVESAYDVKPIRRVVMALGSGDVVPLARWPDTTWSYEAIRGVRRRRN